MSTAYDCWRSDEEPVSWDAILQVFSENAAKVTALLKGVVSRMGAQNNIGGKQ
jgi:5'-methylthioadenosine phosphorylase